MRPALTRVTQLAGPPYRPVDTGLRRRRGLEPAYAGMYAAVPAGTGPSVRTRPTDWSP